MNGKTTPGMAKGDGRKITWRLFLIHPLSFFNWDITDNSAFQFGILRAFDHQVTFHINNLINFYFARDINGILNKTYIYNYIL